MASFYIYIAFIVGNNFLVSAHVSFIQVQQISPKAAITKTPSIPITSYVGNFKFEEADLKQSTTSSTQHMKNRKKKQIAWLDDFGYNESIQDELIQAPGFSSNNTVMSDTQESCGNCECGLRFRYKIVGGVVTKKLEYPWIAVLLYHQTVICGGSLINDRYVITAAHCVQGINHKSFKVRFNEFNLYTPDETKSITVKISKVIVHPQYNPAKFNKDVALLKLARPLTMGSVEVPRPICLPLPDSNFHAGLNAVAAGWGHTKYGGTTSAKLLKVTLPIVSHETCKANYYALIPITKFMICAGFEDGGKSTCQGDSGGPLMVAQEKRYRLAGITSFAAGCALPNYPGVYTRVSEILPFIEANTKDACYCK